MPPSCRRWSCLLAGVLITALTAAGCSSDPSHHGGASDSTATARPAAIAPCTTAGPSTPTARGLPDITLRCLGRGPAVDAGKIAGPAVVNLWASWCYPCRKEMPLLQAQAEAGDRVRIIGVDTNDQAAHARRFARTTVHATYEQLSDPSGKLAVALHAPGLPYTFAIDSSGAVVWRKAGKLTGHDIHAAVRAALTGD